MKIKFKNTLEDGVAFNKYHYSNSDTFKEQKKKTTIYSPIGLFLLILVLFAMIQDIRIIIWGSVFILFYLFFILRAYNKDMYKTVKQLYKELDMKGFVCEHLLEISEEGVFEQTDVNERKDKWSGVHSISSNQSYAFIYVGAIQAHIIPRERIIEGNFGTSFLKLQNYFGKNIIKNKVNIK